MNHRFLRHFSLVLVACSHLLACDSAHPRVVESPKAQPQVQPKPATTNTVVFQAPIGGLNENKVKRAFDAAMHDVSECLAQGYQVLPFLEGEIEVFVRVDQDGSTRWAFPLRSTFGHQATEACIIEAVSKQHWPKPEGGRNGKASHSFSMETGGKPALALTTELLGKKSKKLSENLQKCQDALKDAGKARLSLTLHIDPAGKVMAAGAAASDEAGREGIACALKAAEDLTFDSPGGYPGKITLEAAR